MHEEELGKIYGDLKIIDIVRHSAVNDSKRWYAKCECIVCGAIGLSRLDEVKKGRSRGCKNYPSKIEIKDNIVNVFLHTGEILILDKYFYNSNPNKRYSIGGKGYPSQGTGWNGKHSSVHRAVMGIPDPEIKIDHRDRNKLDNRKENLRICTTSQNGMNQGIQKRERTSNFKGVRKRVYAKSTSYIARIKLNKKEYYLGSFKDELEAANAYDKKAIELYGEFVLTNKSLGLL